MFICTQRFFIRTDLLWLSLEHWALIRYIYNILLYVFQQNCTVLLAYLSLWILSYVNLNNNYSKIVETMLHSWKIFFQNILKYFKSVQNTNIKQFRFTIFHKLNFLSEIKMLNEEEEWFSAKFPSRYIQSSCLVEVKVSWCQYSEVQTSLTSSSSSFVWNFKFFTWNWNFEIETW